MNPPALILGSLVRGADGESLGQIVRCEADAFVVKHGRFLPRLLDVAYDEIAEIRGNEVVLRGNPSGYSEADASQREPGPPERVTGAEAGYDFGGDDKPPVSSLDSDRRVGPLEAGIDFGAHRKIIS